MNEPGGIRQVSVAPIAWHLATVDAVLQETSSVRTLVLRVPGWPGHRAGQHVDVRLTAEDGYQAERSYSIASPPEDPRVALTIERLDDGEVSPYLTDVLRVGDQLELRGPIGGYFAWDVTVSGPLLLVAGGAGVVPLMSMLRHREAAIASNPRARHESPARLLYSSRRLDDVIYRDELARLAQDDETLDGAFTLTRSGPRVDPCEREDGPGRGRKVWTAISTQLEQRPATNRSKSRQGSTGT